ncbi:hypothetical protein NDU88_007204 [Pleurodeles waltl]|uniref:Uncharacterized protein n=1 Tax=Pleurodeles waltl TaxID=8319 RepID=A0AAV7NSF8_PLEWA|nr:hypothetical protein NDU88_007204 [Pleurodeles waltl]
MTAPPKPSERSDPCLPRRSPNSTKASGGGREEGEEESQGARVSGLASPGSSEPSAASIKRWRLLREAQET